MCTVNAEPERPGPYSISRKQPHSRQLPVIAPTARNIFSPKKDIQVDDCEIETSNETAITSVNQASRKTEMYPLTLPITASSTRLPKLSGTSEDQGLKSADMPYENPGGNLGPGYYNNYDTPSSEDQYQNENPDQYGKKVE